MCFRNTKAHLRHNKGITISCAHPTVLYRHGEIQNGAPQSAKGSPHSPQQPEEDAEIPRGARVAGVASIPNDHANSAIVFKLWETAHSNMHPGVRRLEKEIY